MRTYTPSGKGHVMLAKLEEASAKRIDLELAAAPHTSASKRRKLWRVVLALREDGLVWASNDALYHLTPAGVDALNCLREGYPVYVAEPVWESPLAGGNQGARVTA